MSNDIQKISVDLIDDPHVAMRTHVDEEKLEELANSIKSVGLIQPISLRRVNDRYEIIAGHRRFLATKIAGLPVIDSVVLDIGENDAENLKAHENLFREDVNPVDEARYIVRLVDRFNYTPAEMAKMFGKSETYVRARYELLQYPDYLIEAVQNEKISLTAARWLVQITDERVLREYTRFAISGGITAKRAEAWFRSWNAGVLPQNAADYVAPVNTTTPNESKIFMRCILCQHDDNIESMGMFYAHPDCEQAVRSRIDTSQE